MPQKPLKSLNGSAAMLTVARPTTSPALVNSVICVRQDRAVRVRVALVPAPAGHVAEVLAEAGDVGRLGEVGASAPMNSGRPYSFLANALTYAPQAPSAARLGCFSPGFFHISGG